MILRSAGLSARCGLGQSALRGAGVPPDIEGGHLAARKRRADFSAERDCVPQRDQSQQLGMAGRAGIILHRPVCGHCCGWSPRHSRAPGTDRRLFGRNKRLFGSNHRLFELDQRLFRSDGRLLDVNRRWFMTDWQGSEADYEITDDHCRWQFTIGKTMRRRGRPSPSFRAIWRCKNCGGG
jgi:hypothetical protein